MPGQVVLACYRPQPGREPQLLELVRRHVPALRELGLASSRPVLLLRAADGAFIEIFEWVDEAAAGRAHDEPVVQELWGSMGEVAEFVAPAALAGLDHPFPHLEPVEGVVD